MTTKAKTKKPGTALKEIKKNNTHLIQIYVPNNNILQKYQIKVTN
jgi:hypothetical protein